MAELSIDQVRKKYPGGVEAVKGISLDIADGEFIVLVGPSGCGKSTLLRMVAGLESITEGEISIGGRVVNDIEPADRDIAMVFQNYALYPHMTVYNNLAYGLRKRRTSKAEIDRRVKEAAGILELTQLLDRKPRQLSGGQRQRVAMGRAIVRDPAAFLFDEPLSNLDAKLRVQMRVEIKSLQRKLGTTSLYVTHDQLEAMTLGDRLVVMNEGRVEQVGTPIEVYEKPATVFVASFIGSPGMNLIPMKANGSAFVSSDADGARMGKHIDQNEIIAGVRPESFVVSPGSSAAPDDSSFSLDLTVAAVEPVGHESFVHGTLGDHGPAIVMRAAGRVDHVPGTRLSAHARQSDVHLFTPSDGLRV